MYIGRTKILCDEPVVTADNVVQVLTDALLAHQNNSAQCDYLYNYYRGNQPILQRVKTIRPEICNKIVENRANEIVSFKTGYLCGEPLQYVSRGSTDEISTGIQSLNDFMLLNGKAALDKSLAEWMYICGVGCRMIQPNRALIKNEIEPNLKKGKTVVPADEPPFEAFTLDPRYSFVVYHSGLGEKPLFGVKYVTKQDKSTVYTVYTATQQFTITMSEGQEATISESVNPLGAEPIIEYPLNNARLGAFEIVMPILDAINTTQSNRLDGVEQFIQSLLIFTNCDIDDDAAKSLRAAGLIKLKSIGDIKAEVKEIAEALDQQQTQTLTDYMYQTVLNIVGMPNRNGGSSTSDTGAATIVRDGWAAAEARAKDDEIMFKESERRFLKIVLRILRDTVGTPLSLVDVETKFTRRNYENIQTKSQVLTSMLASDKIAPELAFTHCGMFSDPQDAYRQSKAHYEKVKNEQKQEEPPDGNSGNGKTGNEAA
jgi:SPP1 family phage portal protein